jgi:hypothetical protein
MLLSLSSLAFIVGGKDESLSKGIAETFGKNRWSEDDFFDIVERYRDEALESSENIFPFEKGKTYCPEC